MVYSLEGQRITQVCVEFAIVLQTVDGTELRIEAPFRVISADGLQLITISPENLHVEGGAVVGFLHQQIVLATIEDSGALAMEFAAGQRLECDPDPQFEAWTLATSAGERMVCLPGGGVARWPETSSPQLE